MHESLNSRARRFVQLIRRTRRGAESTARAWAPRIRHAMAPPATRPRGVGVIWRCSSVTRKIAADWRHSGVSIILSIDLFFFFYLLLPIWYPPPLRLFPTGFLIIALQLTAHNPPRFPVECTHSSPRARFLRSYEL